MRTVLVCAILAGLVVGPAAAQTPMAPTSTPIHTSADVICGRVTSDPGGGAPVQGGVTGVTQGRIACRNQRLPMLAEPARKCSARALATIPYTGRRRASIRLESELFETVSIRRDSNCVVDEVLTIQADGLKLKRQEAAADAGWDIAKVDLQCTLPKVLNPIQLKLLPGIPALLMKTTGKVQLRVCMP